MIVKRHPVFKIENFLNREENLSILDYAINQEKKFQLTCVTTNVENYRKSQVLYDFPGKESFLNKLKYFIPIVTESLWLGIADTGKIECQLTAHQNQDFFKLHTDSNETCHSRLITYVYYFHRDPKLFAGGELLIHDTKFSKVLQPAPTFQLIYPENNCLIFFESKCFHEVLPVRVPSESFEDSRFTINGWIHAWNPEDLQPSLAILP